jgi:hypothetical protein
MNWKKIILYSAVFLILTAANFYYIQYKMYQRWAELYIINVEEANREEAFKWCMDRQLPNLKEGYYAIIITFEQDTFHARSEKLQVMDFVRASLFPVAIVAVGFLVFEGYIKKGFLFVKKRCEALDSKSSRSRIKELENKVAELEGRK